MMNVEVGRGTRDKGLVKPSNVTPLTPKGEQLLVLFAKMNFGIALFPFRGDRGGEHLRIWCVGAHVLS